MVANWLVGNKRLCGSQSVHGYRQRLLSAALPFACLHSCWLLAGSSVDLGLDAFVRSSQYI